MFAIEYTMQHPLSGDTKRKRFSIEQMDAGVAGNWRTAHEQQGYTFLAPVVSSKVSSSASHETRILSYGNKPPIQATPDTVITLPCYLDQIVGKLNEETAEIIGLGWFTVCRDWADKKAQELNFQDINDFLNSCGSINENTIDWPHQAIREHKLIGLGAGDMNKYS